MDTTVTTTTSRGEWRDHIRVPARIVKVTDETVHLDCLLETAGVMEERVFDRDLFDDPEVGSYWFITIKERPGALRFDFEQDDGSVDREPFERPTDGVEDLDESAFNEPLSDER